MQNIVDVLQKRAQTHPHQKAVLYLEDGKNKTGCLTYSELDKEARIIAAHLQDHKMAGNSVLLIYPVGIEFITALIGCWYAGVIAVPIPCPKVNEFEKHQAFLNSIAEDADVAAVLSLEIYCFNIKNTIKREVPVFATNVLQTPSSDSNPYHDCVITEETIAYLQYTSGSTSTPKAAIVSHGNLQHSVQETIKVWHYTKKSITLTWAPHTHVYGLVCGILVPLYHGTLAMIMPTEAFIHNPITWLSTISTYRVTHSGCPNFGYDICVRDIKNSDLPQLNLKHWKVAINGGDNVQCDTLLAFAKKFRMCGFELKQCCSAYGMSELSGAIAVTPLNREPHFLTLQEHSTNQNGDQSRRQLVSSGKLLFGIHVVIVNPETMLPVADGEIGEIWLSGKSVVSGYWRRPDESNEVFNAKIPGDNRSYFKTGDLGLMLNKEIYLTGRLKEVIVVYGKKYYPLDFELTVAKALVAFQIHLPQVVFSIKSSDKEEIIVVQEMPEEMNQSIWPKIINEIRHAITKHHGVEIHEVVFTSKGMIPRTNSGKLQRKKTQLFFQQKSLEVLTLASEEETKNNTNIPGRIKDHFITLVANVLKIEEKYIDLQAPLSHYSFDSINIIQLTNLLNEGYQLSLSPAALYEYSTLSDFYTDLLDKKGIESFPEKHTQQHTETNDIAIIGMNGVFPQSPDLDTFWNNLYQGKDCISEVPLSRWDWRDSTVKWGGFLDHVDHFDASFFNISPHEAELIDPQQRLFLQTVWKTIEDAGYTHAALSELKTGLFVGVFNHDYAELLQNNEVMDAYLTTGTMNSMIANRISYLLNLRGPSETIDTACSSSLVAVHQAVQAILLGDCDVGIAGGVNALITPTSYRSAKKAGMLSEEGRCKTFDKDANGYVRGEGAGAILLKKLTHALKDGDHIYGVIKGTAVNHGGHVKTLTAPNPKAQAEVIVSACQRAKVPIDSIQYIETHGTGTPLGDPIEINGLKIAFQRLALEQGINPLPERYCGLGSVKTHIGHLESAAGIVGIIKTLLAMRHETMPANLHFSELNPYIEIEKSPFYILNKTSKWPKIAGKLRRAGVSSFGFGGTNAHIILEESPKQKNPSYNDDQPYYLITLSAMTASALKQRIIDLLQWLDNQEDLPCLAALSYTLNSGREHFAKRFCVIVKTVEDLKKQLSDDNKRSDFLPCSKEDELPFDLKKIHHDYLQGQSINWRKLYGDYQEKISLPTYPFAKESHWVKIKNKPRTRLHPLIDENVSTLSSLAFIKRFTGNEIYLREHQLNNESVLPGAVCLEMARTAASMVLEKHQVTTLSNIHWKKPIKPADWSSLLSINLFPQTDALSFEITDHDKTVCHMSGEIHYTSAPSIIQPSFNIEELKSTLISIQLPDAIYSYFKHAGLSYGPSFQVIQKIHYDDKNLLAELTLSSSFQSEENELILFPCLLDGILQTTQALLKNREVLYLPYSIKQLDIHGILSSTCYVHASLISDFDNQYMPVFDIQVMDNEGALLVLITGFTLGAVNQDLKQKMVVRYYHPVWVEQPLPAPEKKRPNSMLILGENEQTLKLFQAQFGSNTTSYQLIQDVLFANSKLELISDCILIPLETFEKELVPVLEIQKHLEQSYFLIHALVVKITQLKLKHPIQLVCISTKHSLYSRALAGFSKTLHQEQSNLSCRFIELSDLNMLADELMQDEIQVRYDEHNRRYVNRYELISNVPELTAPVIKPSGVYLITGGMGGLGYWFASYLAEHYQAKIVITGRSVLSDDSIKRINDLEMKGASVDYVSADVSSYEEVKILIEHTKKRFGPIKGIIHAAGIIQDGLIQNKTEQDITRVLKPKVYGTSYLHAATCNEPLDFFIMFSSVAAVFGNAGQSDYAYANCFQDEFARERQQQTTMGHCFGQTLSINWPLWEEGGLKILPEYQKILEQSLGIVSLTTQQGLDAFLNALESKTSNFIVLPGNQEKLFYALNQSTQWSQAREKSDNQISINASDLREKTKAFLKNILAEALKCSPNSIESDVSFERYGIDSLMIIQLNQRLEKEFTRLPKTLFFEYQNVSDLADYFIEYHANELNQQIAHPVIPKFNLIRPLMHSIKSKDFKPSESQPKDIAIIGIDGRYPEAKNLMEFWENLKAGKDCIREIPKERWSVSDFFDENKNNPGKTYSKWGGFLADVDAFDPLFFNISPREAVLMDPQERLFLETAWKTIEGAGYAHEQLAGQKVGVYVGVMYGQYQLFCNETSQPFAPTNSVFSSIANRVSYFFDFHGPSIALDTMCSSSLTAIHLACQSINQGECDLALAGGVNLSLHPNKYLLLSHGKFLASDGHCRSFGNDGDGYVPGEGVGAVLLKPLDRALADGDFIYAVIKGSQINHGGKTNGYTVPNPNAQAEVIAKTYQEAKVDPRLVSYLEAHGTGTPLGDPIEIAGLNKVFTQKDVTHYCAIGSVKSNIGHCESAAGIASLTKVVLQLHHQILVPSIFSETLNTNVDWSTTPFKVQQTISEWKTNDNASRISGISSFGAGGSNAHLIISEAPETPSSSSKEKPYYLLTVSAKTEQALRQRLQDLLVWFERNPSAHLEPISYTLNAGRSHFDCRFAMVVSSLDEAIQLLQQLNEQQHPDNVFIQINRGTQPNNLIQTTVLPLIMNQLSSPLQYKETLLILAKFYVDGMKLDWNKLHVGESKKKIPLPTYPFAKERYWYSDEMPLGSIGNCHTDGSRPICRGLSEASMDPADKPWDVGARMDYQQTKSPYTQETLVAKRGASVDQIVSFLTRQVTRILKITHHQIELQKNLGEYGMDSVHFIELAKQIAEYYQVEFTPAVFYKHANVQSISQYLIDQWPETIAHETSIEKIKKKLDDSPRMERIASQDIAIIGMQGLFPQSDDLATFWHHLASGHDLVTEIPIERWDWRDYYGEQADKSNSKWGAFIHNADQFDAGFFNISAREANLMDPQQRLFLETVWKTIEDAGYDPLTLQSQKVGVFAGVEFSEYQTLIATAQKEHHGFIATGNSHSMIANRVSYFFNFQGPSEVIDTACSSSLVAIHRAVQAIGYGECDLAIAGGVSLILDPNTMVVTSQLGALSPDGRCKTFDKSANGYVKGEGVGSLLLKPLNQAQEDGDFIYGVIKASAVNHGGKAQSLTAPNATAQSKLLLHAYTQANISPDTITYIETHGTGTALGDPVEIEGLKLAFNKLAPGAKSKQIALGSLKTNIGHLEPASGIAGVIKVILAMTHETIPSMLHLNELNPYIHLEDTPFYIAKEAQAWQRLRKNTGEEVPLRAGVSSFGFGGTNAHIVIEESRPHQKNDATNQSKPYYLIALSAKHNESLQQKIVDLVHWLTQNQDTISLPSLSFTLNAGRAHFIYRLAFVVDSVDSLISSLNLLKNNETPEFCMINEGQSYTAQGPVFDEVYQSAIRSLKQPENPKQYCHQLFILADLYTKNYSIDWYFLYEGETVQRIGSLPSYPFIKQRYWYDLEINPIPSSNLMNSVTDPSSLRSAVYPRSPLGSIALDLANKSRDVVDGIEVETNFLKLVLDYLRNVFAEKLRTTPEKIQTDETYEVYGVDSLIGLEITTRLEKDFGGLPKTLLYEQNRLSDLAKYFIKNYKERLSDLVVNNDAEIASLEIKGNPPITSIIKDKSNSSSDIAIIGLSGTFPMANNLDEFWHNLLTERDCIVEVPKDRWNYKEYPVLVGTEEKYFAHGGFIPDVDKFDPLFFNISPRDAGLMDPQERLFMQSVWSTLEDAGYTREKLKLKAKNAVGVFAGVTYNFYPLFIAEEWQKGNRVPLDIQTFSIANRISYFLDVHGPSFVVDTACSSSLAAIHLACESIIRGNCAMAIAGGVNLSLHPSKYHFLGSFNLMSEQGRCSSFAEGGTGYVPSEGVSTVLLKPLAEAIADNDLIYAVIKGSSMNHGGKTSGYTVPNPNAQAAVILDALKKANINPRTLSYIEAHGTGTALGDPIEIRGLQNAFEHFTEDKQFCAIGSVKSNIGHLESAAGMSQLAKVVLQMRHKKLVPTLHTPKLNPFIDFKNTPFYVQQELKAWESDNLPRRAGISSFGAGGTNVHLIIEEYELPIKQHTSDGPYIFLLSGMNEDRLAEQVKQMHRYVEQNNYTGNKKWLRDACFTLQTGREHREARFAAVVENKEELMAALTDYPNLTKPNLWINYNDKNLHFLKIAQHWLSGEIIDWEQLYESDLPEIVSLPTYPFTKRRCWIPTKEMEPIPGDQSINQAVESTELLRFQDWLYRTRWEKNPLSAKSHFTNAPTSRSLSAESTDPEDKLRDVGTGKWLFFSEQEQELDVQASIYYRFSGNQFELINDPTYLINASKKSDYEQLFNIIHAELSEELRGVIYLGSRQNKSNEPKHDSSMSLFYLFKAMIKHSWTHQLSFCLATQSAQQVHPEDTINIWQHPLWSMTRIFGAEQADYQVLLLDLDANECMSDNTTTIFNELNQFQENQNHIAYRANERYSLRFIHEAAPHKNSERPHWTAPLAALITGGLGALGYEVAQFIIAQGTQFVLLTGTTELSVQTQEKNIWLKQLEAKGVQVVYAAVDVANKEQMQNLITNTEKLWQQSIDGVFHLAGITTDNVPIADMKETLWNDVLRVKVKGSMVLHELFMHSKPTSFVLFSSIAATPYFGMAGLSAYAVANEFMNGLALYRRSQKLPATSINWVAWSEKGMSHQHNHDVFLDAIGMGSLSIKEGIALFKTILKLNPAEITACKIQWKKFFQVNAASKKLDFFTHFIENKESNEPVVSSLNQEEITTLVRTLFAKVLELELAEIEEDTPFQHYGMDSITGINYTDELGKQFPDVISPMDLYRYPTLKQLTDYIIQRVYIPCEPISASLFDVKEAMGLDQLNYAQLNELIESELNELEQIL